MSEAARSENEDPGSDAAAAAIEDGIAFLRGHLSGLLRFDGDQRPIKVVVALDGSLVASVMVAMLRSIDTTLFLPDEEPEAMHLQVTLEEFQERGPHGAMADRWRIYHGDPPDVRWARITIDAARHDGLFLDGEALMRPNPLATVEPALCRALNAQCLETLRDACRRQREIVLERPVVVGIDPFGLDVRGTFDVIRLESPIVLRHEADVRAALAEIAGT
jgi:hypothetical protein